METILLDKDIKVFYETAASFPDGIMETHRKLHSFLPFSSDRQYFGISRPEQGEIVYKAAAEVMTTEEEEKLNCETMVIKKGKYNCLIVKDFLKNIQEIEKAFAQLTTSNEIDPDGYCIEWYFNDTDIKCMVRLKD